MTYELYNNAQTISETISGANNLLKFSHTGQLNLDGSAYLKNINSSGAAFSSFLRNTGGALFQGPMTGLNASYLKDIISTGNCFFSQITGGLHVTGNSEISGRLDVVGSIYINGTEVGSNVATGWATDITGNYIWQGKGDILLGLESGKAKIFSTGGAQSGWGLLYDPSSELGYRLGPQTGISAGGGTNLSYFQETFADTTSIFSATGSDTSISLNIRPKNQGSFSLGHDQSLARGIFAVDLQRTGNLAWHKAGGSYSVIGGGAFNTNSGVYSVIAGGTGNIIYPNSTGSFAVGRGNVVKNHSSFAAGFLNTLNGTGDCAIGLNNAINSTHGIALGSANSIGPSATYGIAMGGSCTANAMGSLAAGQSSSASVNAPYALAFGNGASANNRGEIAFSAGTSAQTSIFTLVGTTTNNSWTSLTTDGSTLKIQLPANSVWTFRALISAKKFNTSADYAGYELKGVIESDTFNIIGSVTKTVLGEGAGAANYDVQAVGDGGNSALDIQVMGDTSHDVAWGATVEVSQITYAVI